MIAVFVNMGTVLLGSIIGILGRNKIKKAYIDVVFTALSLMTLVIGIMSAVKTEDTMCMIVCTVVGTVIGALLRLDDRIEGLGDFIKGKLPVKQGVTGRFTEGFVVSCVLFCVGSMSIMGSFEAGINGNYSIIFAKSALDFVSSMMFSAAMGIGVPFSVVFILIYQGGLTLLAKAVAPWLSEAVVTEMSAVGGVILIGMAINMLELKKEKIKVADMLPAMFLPAAYLPLYEIITAFFNK